MVGISTIIEFLSAGRNPSVYFVELAQNAKAHYFRLLAIYFLNYLLYIIYIV